MGLLGRRRVETELAWQYSIPNLLEVYRAVLPATAGLRQAWPPRGERENPVRCRPSQELRCESGDPK